MRKITLIVCLLSCVLIMNSCSTGIDSNNRLKEKLKSFEFEPNSYYANENGVYKFDEIDENFKLFCKVDLGSRDENGEYRFCVNKDWVFYCNILEQKIYKINKDGTQKTELLNDEALDMRVYNGRLYFLSNSHTWALVSVNFDGGHLIEYKDTSNGTFQQYISDYAFTKEHIYFSTVNHKVYKINYKNSKISEIKTKNQISEFLIKEDVLYSTYGSLVSINLRTEEANMLDDGNGFNTTHFSGGVDDAVLCEQSFYYFIGATLFQMDVESLNKTIIFKETNTSIFYVKFIYDSKLYYVSTNKNVLFSVDMKTKQHKKVDTKGS